MWHISGRYCGGAHWYGIGGYQEFARALCRGAQHVHQKARTRYDNDFITAGVELLISLVAERKDSGAWVQRPSALAAALERFVSELMDYKHPPLKKDLIKIYGVSLRTLNKYYKIFFEDPGVGDRDVD